MTMKSAIRSRPVTEADFWRVRELLIATVPIAPFGHNWDMRRWDSKYFYNPSGRWEDGWEQGARVWETDAGEVVACVHREGRGGAGLQAHPAYRFLEEELLDCAEGSFAAPAEDGQGRELELFTFEYDSRRQRLLGERSYRPTGEWGMMRHLRLPAQQLPRPSLPAPYTLRTVRPQDDADCQRIADILNAAFRRTFHNGPEFKVFAQLAPSYVNALDLVAVAPDGSFAAYVGMPYDEQNRRGIFEPVCTHPDHLRRGLASCLMFEALARVRQLGAVDVMVDTGDMVAANALYDSMGFTEAYRQVGWKKVW
jgi:mycothiol synthase